jgi:hypothetical protein
VVPGCKSKDKTWPRPDNFRSHLKRIHSDQVRTEEDLNHMIAKYVCDSLDISGILNHETGQNSGRIPII